MVNKELRTGEENFDQGVTGTQQVVEQAERITFLMTVYAPMYKGGPSGMIVRLGSMRAFFKKDISRLIYRAISQVRSFTSSELLFMYTLQKWCDEAK